MVNLLLTMRCNRNCVYCFAREKIKSYSSSSQANDITMEDFERVLNFFEKSGIDSLQLAGGEPTLHERFDDILTKVLDRDIRVNVLSNCLWDSSKNGLFSRISPTRLGFLLNIDHPETYVEKQWKIIEENLSSVQERENTTLSFNIFEKVPKFDYIFDLVSRYSIRNLRLSFSMPVFFGGVNNTYLSMENYKELTPFLMAFVRKAESIGVKVRIDNTVPICMFSKSDLGELLLTGTLEPKRNFVCFPALDIGPDLSIWRCFGTSALFNKKLDDFNSLQEIYDYYCQVFSFLQFKVYPMEECYSCEYSKKQMCQGGCIGFSAREYIKSHNLLELPDSDILDIKPKLREQLSMKLYELPRKSVVFFQNNKSLGEFNQEILNIIKIFDGNKTVREAIATLKDKSNTTERTGDPLDIFLEIAIQDRLLPIIRMLVNTGIFVH